MNKTTQDLCPGMNAISAPDSGPPGPFRQICDFNMDESARGL
jgi:hypothetical protein